MIFRILTIFYGQQWSLSSTQKENERSNTQKSPLGGFPQKGCPQIMQVMNDHFSIAMALWWRMGIAHD
jgi:hypothetical protein